MFGIKSLLGSSTPGVTIINLIHEQNQRSDLISTMALQAMNSILDHPDSFKFRTVPGIMGQVIVYDSDQLEIRIHIYGDESCETYIHNHERPFITYCLDGEYREKSWGIIPESDKFYAFPRVKGGRLGDMISCAGTLIMRDTRIHYPGNCLYIPPDLYHTIEHTGRTSPMTFILKSKTIGISGQSCHVLSPTPTITQPIEQIRSATRAEIDSILNRIGQCRRQRLITSQIQHITLT